MGFMERFKTKGRGQGGTATAELSAFDEVVVPQGRGRDVAPHHAHNAVTLDMNASPTVKRNDRSNIADTAPSGRAPASHEGRQSRRRGGTGRVPDE